MTEPTFHHRADDLADQAAFMRRLARSLVGDEHEADDIAQDASLAALSLSGSPTGSLGAWIAGTVRNLARMRARSEARRRRRESLAARPEALPSAAEQAARTELLERLSTAVARLPDAARTTLLLRYFDDLPPREIARRSGEPIATVKSRLKRSLAELRRTLDDDRGRARWMALLLPLRARSQAVGSTGIAVGALIVSTKAKILAAAAVLLLTLGATVMMSRPGNAPKPEPPDAGVTAKLWVPAHRAPEKRAASASDEPAGATAVADGLVRGVLSLPAGAVDPELAILTRSGLPLLRAPATAGAFALAVPKHQAADRPLCLWAEAAGCRRAEVAIPLGGGEVGTLTLAPGEVYHGWLMDEFDRPVSGVFVELGMNEVSLPSREDGSFRITLPGGRYRPETMYLGSLTFLARGVYYGRVAADAAGLGGGHRVRLTDPGTAPRLRLLKQSDGQPLAHARVALTGVTGPTEDRGMTDEEGRWDPYWRPGLVTAFLVVSDPGGALHILVDRDDLHAFERVDLTVLERGKANLFRYWFVDAENRPVADTELRLRMGTRRRSALLDVWTDTAGKAEFHLWFPEGEDLRLRESGKIERLPSGRAHWSWSHEGVRWLEAPPRERVAPLK